MKKQASRSIKKLFKKKENGETSIVITTIVFLIIFPVGIALLLSQMTLTAKQKTEDDLIYSVLAGALVDTYEYGETNNIIVDDSDQSYKRYLTCLKQNLSLDENMFPQDESLFIGGQVDSDAFIIYNIYRKDGSVLYDKIDVLSGTKEIGNPFVNGTLFTPDGIPVKETSIYAKIRFPYKTFFNIEVPVTLKDLVAIRVN